jgi:cytochrome c-type biogenesis protein CcmH/NrfG
MKLDRFDILILAAVLVLAATALALGSKGEPGQGMTSSAATARIKAAPPDPAAYQEISRDKDLISSDQVDEAVASLKKLASAHPEMSEPHALLGQAYSRVLDYPSSMREFRTALVMDPDYVDKKSGKFIGKRIKAAVKDGMEDAKAKLSKNPDDKAARAELKDAYYLERMLAGGCE